MEGPHVPYENTYWADPGRLIAGGTPLACGNRETLGNLMSLEELGVGTVVDLTEEPLYLHVLRGDPALAGALAYVNIPVRDFTAPTPAVMGQILDAIAAGQSAGRAVFVHCLGGRGRTGTVVGCYLVDRGIAPDGSAALSMIRRLRRGMLKGMMDSPENEEQRRMVRSWRRQDGRHKN